MLQSLVNGKRVQSTSLIFTADPDILTLNTTLDRLTQNFIIQHSIKQIIKKSHKRLATSNNAPTLHWRAHARVNMEAGAELRAKSGRSNICPKGCFIDARKHDG